MSVAAASRIDTPGVRPVRSAMQAAGEPVLVQVSPVERGGVFDYLQCLKAQWATLGTASHAVPLSKALALERSLDERVADCCQRSGHAPQGYPCSIVLHFSGYGFGRRGLCLWLVRELQTLMERRRGAVQLVIVFHELYASGPPWKSAFWLSKAQAWIASRLAGMADVIWTNTERHAGWLRQHARRGTPVHARPVFSNVGEPAANPPLQQRRPVAVVFGSAGTRQRVFDELGRVEHTLRTLGITELIEAGSGGPSRGQPAGVPCRHAGRLDLEALRELLQSARFGLLDYPAQALAKSGVFAAYAAHGCVVLDTREPTPDSDGLQAGPDYLSLHTLSTQPTLHSLQERASRATTWYAQHRLDVQARELRALAGCGTDVD